jgi:ribosomal 50S subunit-recycling heat shock protein
LRIDKFLNSVNITKRRAVSEDMCRNGVVEINEKVVKAAKDVKVGDKITINYLQKIVNYEVLQIPTTKTIPKSKQSEYVNELQ